MGTVYFVRHGQSQANRDGICAGQLESPLTKLGRHQAAEVGQFVVSQRLKFDVILCSPIGRARDTATIIASAIGFTAPPHYLDDLRERNCGDFQGGPNTAYYAADEAFSSKEMHVESVDDLWQRAERVRDYVASHYPDKRVLIVCHSGFGKMLKLAFGGDDPAKYNKTVQLPNAHLIRLA